LFDSGEGFIEVLHFIRDPVAQSFIDAHKMLQLPEKELMKSYVERKTELTCFFIVAQSSADRNVSMMSSDELLDHMSTRGVGRSCSSNTRQIAASKRSAPDSPRPGKCNAVDAELAMLPSQISNARARENKFPFTFI
jgi:hypothetical protein